MYTPRNLIKNYTDILQMFYKGNVPSFQRKISFDQSMSTGKVDGLSLILIDLYVPTLTSRSNEVRPR